MDYDYDAKLRKRIAWLNNMGGFENQILYSSIADAAHGVDEKKVMDILKYLEENWDKVWDPTKWAVSSLQKAKAAGEGLDRSFDQALRRQIRYLNTEGGFNNTITYSKIADAAVGLREWQVMEVLHLLEQRWRDVEDPTAWVCSSLRRVEATHGPTSSSGGRTSGCPQDWDWEYDETWKSAGGFSAEEADRQLRRRIRWLNSTGGFENSIVYSKVAEAASGINITRVLVILKYLEDNWQKVREPTAWICSSLQKESEHMDTDGKQDDSFDRRLRKRIRELNNEGGFGNVIIYTKVAEAATHASQDKVFQVLTKLADRGPQGLKDPTSWICRALGGGKSSGGGSSAEWKKDEQEETETASSRPGRWRPSKV